MSMPKINNALCATKKGKNQEFALETEVSLKVEEI